jgi:hypothetical protein
MEHRKVKFDGPNHVRCRVVSSVPVELCSFLMRATTLDINVSAGSPIGWLMQVAIHVSCVLCSLRSAPWLFQSIRRFLGSIVELQVTLICHRCVSLLRFLGL